MQKKASFLERINNYIQKMYDAFDQPNYDDNQEEIFKNTYAIYDNIKQLMRDAKKYEMQDKKEVAVKLMQIASREIEIYALKLTNEIHYD